MNIDDFKKILKPVKGDSQQDKLQRYYELTRMQQSQQPFYPPKGLGAPAGAIGGPLTVRKIPYPYTPEKIKADILERLTGQIANLCTKYNLSDTVDMETEVTMVEVNGTTTVTLTATINWLPNPFVFVAMESFQEPPF
jgi:hypothetical protein